MRFSFIEMTREYETTVAILGYLPGVLSCMPVAKRYILHIKAGAKASLRPSQSGALRLEVK